MIFFNVVLAYGMETSFLGFNKEPNKSRGDVDGFNLDHYFIFSPRSLFRDNLAEWSRIDSQYITYTIWILALDWLSYHFQN
jgi:hypothetical protein